MKNFNIRLFNKIVQLCLNSQIGMTFKLWQSKASIAVMFWQLHLIYSIWHVSMGKTHHLLNIKSWLLDINLSDVALCINCRLTWRGVGQQPNIWYCELKLLKHVQLWKRWERRTEKKENIGGGVSVQNCKLGNHQHVLSPSFHSCLNSVVKFLTNYLYFLYYILTR